MNTKVIGMKERSKEIREFIINTFLFGEPGDLEDDNSLLDSGVIDSTGVLELVTHLEETYRIEVLDLELVPKNLDSINAIAAYLDRKISGKEPSAL